MKNFTRKIRAYIENNDTSQVALADKLGMSTASLSMYLTGNRTPSIEVVTKIERKLGLPTGYLIYDVFAPIEKTKRLPILHKKDIDNFLNTGILPKGIMHLPIFFDSKKGYEMSKNCFFIAAEGDAMSSADSNEKAIYNGEYVAIDPDLEADHLSTVLIKTKDDFKLRKILKDGSDKYYSANNKDFPTINSSQAEVIGRVFLKLTLVD